MEFDTKGKYHIGKNGPARCGAIKRRCPYADTGHFDSQREAEEVYAASQDIVPLKGARKVTKNAREFGSEIASLYESMTRDTYGTYWEVEGRKRPFERVFFDSLCERLSEDLDDDVVEEDTYPALRKVGPSFSRRNIADPEVSQQLYADVLKEMRRQEEGLRSISEVPEKCFGYARKKVGDEKVAQSLIAEVRALGERFDISRLDGPNEAPKGFTFLGNGYECAAFVHNDSQVVYKVPWQMNRERTVEYGINAVFAEEGFPKTKGLEFVHSTSYFHGDSSIVAQEMAQGKHVKGHFMFSKDQFSWLTISGHNDIVSDNYRVSEDGTFVCFDTYGRIADDMEASNLPHLFRIED